MLVPGRIPAGEAVESFCYIRRHDAAPPHSSAISPGSLQSPALFTQFFFTIHPYLWLTGTPRRLLLARRRGKTFHDWALLTTSCCFQPGGKKLKKCYRRFFFVFFLQEAELTCRLQPHKLFQLKVFPKQGSRLFLYMACNLIVDLWLIWLKGRMVCVVNVQSWCSQKKKVPCVKVWDARKPILAATQAENKIGKSCLPFSVHHLNAASGQ